MVYFVLIAFFAICGGILAFIKSQKDPFVKPTDPQKGALNMKYCSKCGNQLADQAVICVNCGNQLASVTNSSAGKLKTNRGLLKFILLSMITFGIYGLVVMSSVSTDINIIAGRYDGKKTMHYCLLYFIFSWLTLGIAPLVWYNNISARIGNELKRRGISYSFGAGSFWGWFILGSSIVVGPFIYMHKLLKSMNLLSESFNTIG